MADEQTPTQPSKPKSLYETLIETMGKKSPSTFSEAMEWIILYKAVKDAFKEEPITNSNQDNFQKLIEMLISNQAQNTQTIIQIMTQTNKETKEMLQTFMQAVMQMKQNELEMEHQKKEEEAKAELEAVKQYYEAKIDELASKFDAMKNSLPANQVEQVNRNMSILEQLRKAMDDYRDLQSFFQELGTIVGSGQNKDKGLNIKEIVNNIKEVAEPIIESTQTILGIAQQTPVTPPENKPFIPAQPPKKQQGEVSPPPKAEVKPVEHANAPIPKSEVTLPPPQPKKEPPAPPPADTDTAGNPLIELPKEWSPDPYEKVQLDQRDLREISKVFDFKEFELGGKKDIAVVMKESAPNGEPIFITDEHNRLVNKDQFTYLYMTDPEFRKGIKEIMKG